MGYVFHDRHMANDARAMVIWRRADGEPWGRDLGPISTALPEPRKAPREISIGAAADEWKSCSQYIMIDSRGSRRQSGVRGARPFNWILTDLKPAVLERAGAAQIYGPLLPPRRD